MAFCIFHVYLPFEFCNASVYLLLTHADDSNDDFCAYRVLRYSRGGSPPIHKRDRVDMSENGVDVSSVVW